jgi:hypothetical protein
MLEMIHKESMAHLHHKYTTKKQYFTAQKDRFSGRLAKRGKITLMENLPPQLQK